MILKKFNDLIIPLEESWKSNRYRDNVCKSNISMELNKNKLITVFNDEIDNLFLYAIREYDNLNTILIIGKNKKESYDLYLEEFKKNYILFGIKEITLKISLLIKILYQSLSLKHNINDYDTLLKKIKEITVLSSRITKPEDINKTIKISILITCSRTLKRPEYLFHYDNFINYSIFIPDTIEQKIIFCTTYFSNTTLNLLSLQNINKLLNKNNPTMNKSDIMLKKYRSWLYEEIPIKYHDKFMIFSSVVLYLLGLRGSNDLDLYVDALNDKYRDKMVNLVKSNKFDFIDYSIKNTEYWKIYWDKWLDEWARQIGLLYFEEILCNPKYHFYYMGLKIISLECDIARRIIRNRPRSIADLIAINKLCPLKIKIPEIPSMRTIYYTISELDEREIKKLTDKGGIINKANREIKIEEKVNQTIFINVIKKTLRERYNIHLSDIDIKKLVGLESHKKIIKIKVKK